MKWALIFLFASLALLPAASAADASLFYSKSFPASKPPYVQITLAQNGDVEYREDPKEDDPIKFHLQDSETQEIFGLVEKAGSLDETATRGQGESRLHGNQDLTLRERRRKERGPV